MTKKTTIVHAGENSCILSSAEIFSKSTKKFFQEYHEAIKVFDPDQAQYFQGLFWVRTIYKVDQQTTLTGKEY